MIRPAPNRAGLFSVRFRTYSIVGIFIVLLLNLNYLMLVLATLLDQSLYRPAERVCCRRICQNRHEEALQDDHPAPTGVSK
jgi:hypothetical protein